MFELDVDFEDENEVENGDGVYYMSCVELHW